MTWAVQVWHVFRKDVLHLRWMLLGYVLCVLVMIVQPRLFSFPSATSNDVLSTPRFVVWLIVPLLLVAYSMFVVIVATLDDSAAKADAGWRVLPLDASAVLVAKLLVIAFLIVLGVAGQSVRISQMALDGTQWLAASGSTAATLLCWLLIALLVASVTRNLVGAVLLFLVGTLALFTLSVVASRFLPRARFDSLLSNGYPDWYGEVLWTQWPFAVLVLVSLIALIALYRRIARDRWAASISVALCLLLAFAGCGPRSREGVGDPLPSSVRVTSTSTLRGKQEWVPRVYTTIAASGLAPTDRFVLDSGSITLVFGERDTVRAPLGYQGATRGDSKNGFEPVRARHVILSEPSRVPIGTLAWPTSAQRVLRTLFDSLPPELIQRLRAESVYVSVTGIAYVLRANVSVATAVGAPRRWDRGVSVAAYDTTDAGVQVLVAPVKALTALHPAGTFEEGASPFHMTPLLVREPMREVLPLYSRFGRTTMVPMVLPGLGGREINFAFSASSDTERDTMRRSEWIPKPSTLWLVSWREVGRYKFATRSTPLQLAGADTL